MASKAFSWFQTTLGIINTGMLLYIVFIELPKLSEHSKNSLTQAWSIATASMQNAEKTLKSLTKATHQSEHAQDTARYALHTIRELHEQQISTNECQSEFRGTIIKHLIDLQDTVGAQSRIIEELKREYPGVYGELIRKQAAPREDFDVIDLEASDTETVGSPTQPRPHTKSNNR